MILCAAVLFSFQSTLPARGATRAKAYTDFLRKFQSTLPARGATRTARYENAAGNPFQSTLPARGATGHNFNRRESRCDFNPRSPHGERHKRGLQPLQPSGISIHAPRTGSDLPPAPAALQLPISIHAPRTGSDRRGWCSVPAATPFQSTLPARGATQSGATQRRQFRRFQSTLPARGATAFPSLLIFPSAGFQSTLPARGATRRRRSARSGRAFQSTLPARGATSRVAVLQGDKNISIHAPRTGSDLPFVTFHQRNRVFQSTLPARGATVRDALRSRLMVDFNPRSPHGERLYDTSTAKKLHEISIHAPRTGSDLPFVTFHQRNRDFNPRSPHGERPRVFVAQLDSCAISIHAPRTGSDCLL